MSITLTRWTVDEYHQMIAAGVLAGKRVELIDGQIVDMAPELPIHRAINQSGADYLKEQLSSQSVIFVTAPITLPSDGEPEPDISVIMPPKSRYFDRHPGPDDIYLLIEVSNTTLSYDLGKKAEVYARDRIQEYWVIDIPNKQLWVHRNPQSEGYTERSQITEGTISPLAFPDIDIQINKLFL